MTAIEKAEIAELDTLRVSAKEASTKKLKERFAEGIRIVRDKLLELAVTLAELESRGEEVQADRHLLKLLRAIASGKLLVDVVVRFAGRPYTLASVAGKPVEEQARVMQMDDDEVELMFRKAKKAKGRCEPVEVNGTPGGHYVDRGEEPFQPIAPSATDFTPPDWAPETDIADKCLELVLSAPDPSAVAARLVPKLESLIRR